MTTIQSKICWRLATTVTTTVETITPATLLDQMAAAILPVDLTAAIMDPVPALVPMVEARHPPVQTIAPGGTATAAADHLI